MMKYILMSKQILHMLSLVGLQVLLFGIFVVIAPSEASAVTYNLATTTNFNIRVDGPEAGTSGIGIGYFEGIDTPDLDNNGKADLVITYCWADNNSRTNSGSVYVLFDSLLDNYTGTANTIDLSSSAGYSARYDGALSEERLGCDAASASDVNGDGIVDLILGAKRADYNSRSDSGSAYIVYSTLVDDYASSTGNNVDLSTTTNFNFRIDGPTASQLIMSHPGYSADVNGNGTPDLLINGHVLDFNSRSNSGSVYILYDSLLDDYTGTGNTLDLNSASSYNVRLDGATAGSTFGSQGIISGDINYDNKADLVITAVNETVSGQIGAAYVFYSTLLDDYTTTGNNVDTATATNYNIKFYSSDANPGFVETQIIDLNNDGLNDLVLDGYFTTVNASQEGAISILYSTILDDYSGTGNDVNVGTSTNYNVRILGGSASLRFGYPHLEVADINEDGRADLIVPTNTGSVYVIYSSLLDAYSGTGNSFSVSNSANYNSLYQHSGAFGHDFASGDIDGNGKNDLVMGVYNADYNSRTDSGSIFIVWNFPHSISKNNAYSTFSPNSTFIVTGSVSASNSVTGISAVQYLVDSNSPSGGWSNCSATDGAFNSTSESYSCTASIAGLSNSSHTIYIRAFDDNISYTPQASYASHTVTIGTSAISSLSVVPAAVSSGAGDTSMTVTWTTSEVASTIVDYGTSSSYGTTTTEADTSPRVTSHSVTISNLKLCELYHFRIRSTDTTGNTASSEDNIVQTGGCQGSTSTGSTAQTDSSASVVTADRGGMLSYAAGSSPEHTVTVILETGTVPFSATLSVETTTLQALSAPNSIMYGCLRLYGVTPPQKVFLISLFNKAQILPILLRKPVLISLRYSLFDLVAQAYPDGRPKRMYNPHTFKLAYSQNGKTRWTVLKNSVVDPVNRTVSAIHKIGGYYRIVGSTGRQCSSKYAMSASSKDF